MASPFLTCQKSLSNRNGTWRNSGLCTNLHCITTMSWRRRTTIATSFHLTTTALTLNSSPASTLALDAAALFIGHKILCSHYTIHTKFYSTIFYFLINNHK